MRFQYELVPQLAVRGRQRMASNRVVSHLTKTSFTRPEQAMRQICQFIIIL